MDARVQMVDHAHKRLNHIPITASALANCTYSTVSKACYAKQILRGRSIGNTQRVICYSTKRMRHGYRIIFICRIFCRQMDSAVTIKRNHAGLSRPTFTGGEGGGGRSIESPKSITDTYVMNLQSISLAFSD